jgi:hypothetical protein
MNAFMPICSSLLSRAVLMMVLLVVAGPVALGDSTSFVSDDFNSRNLKRPPWSFTNPENDATLRASNTGNDSAAIGITVPAGRSHDISSGGYRVPRILQPATDTDFRLEAKFFSGVTGGSPASYQLQGIVVEQNNSNIIRFDFTTSASSPNFRIYCATYSGGFSSGNVRVNQEIGPQGTRPLWMRVERAGNTWTQSYSFNGSDWTVATTFVHALTVARVGVFAGNAGSSPESHTALVDYFINLDNPGPAEDSDTNPPDDVAPLIYGIKVNQSATNALELSWRTDEPSTCVLDYGVTASYGSTVVLSTPATFHSVLLTNLQPSISYDFRVTAADDIANSNASGNNIGRTDDVVADASSASDEFGGTQLDAALWSQVNPVGDGTFSVSGGELMIGVPSGTGHDIWTTGARAPRVMQTVTNPTTIVAEAKFLSGVTGSATAFQLQGLLFEQDASNAIRFDFVNGGSGTRAFAASFAGGYSNGTIRVNSTIQPLNAAPLFMRVTRDGALWSMEYSIDGVSWTLAGTFWHFMDVNAVGVFGGNAGTSPPAFTTRVEYFKAALPGRIVLSSPANGATDLPTNPDLTWQAGLQVTTHQLEVASDSLFTTVAFRDTNIAGTSRIPTGLANLTKYFWRVRGKNALGYGGYSIPWSFTTQTSAPNAPALVFPANGATGQAVNLALLWNRITGATSYRVQVSTEATFTSGLIVDDPAVIDTTKPLSALTAGAKYYWRVNASSAGGTSDFSSAFDFTVAAAIPGAVTLTSPDNGASVNAAGVTFNWQAPAGATKYWHELAVDPLFQFVIIDSTLTGTSKTSSGLIANQTYYWRVKAGNVSGWGPYSEGRNFVAIIVGVKEERGIPTTYELSQNFPNPFNPATTIEFAVPREAHVTLDVYNAIGERVATLLDEHRGAGWHTVSFDASSLPSGVYLYRINAGQFTSVRKMLLTK